MNNGGATPPPPSSPPPPPPPPPPPLPPLTPPPPPPKLSDVGILRLAVYVPRTAVSQSDLEAHDGASHGKYTIGLGQTHMAYVTDREDVISLALTAISALIRDAGISYRDIGRLDVGTETILDKSKSIKTSLMRLFVAAGNPEVEGLDSTNACYGSTAALFNAVAWAESTAWDGRYAAVVATDVAVYAPGPARPTGGAAAVALLIGRNAPLRFETRLRTTVMGDSYDFFKPRVDVEYPTVRGQLSIDTYVHALDECYARFCQRADRVDGKRFSVATSTDFCVFHAPFHKLVRKSFARLVYHDFARSLRHAAGEHRTNHDHKDRDNDDDNDNDNKAGNNMNNEKGNGVMDDHFYKPVQRFSKEVLQTSDKSEVETGRKKAVGCDRETIQAFVEFSHGMFEEKCNPAAWLAREIGNCYTASLYTSLAALLECRGDDLLHKRILMYAFGSGFAASMYALRVTGRVDGIVVGTPLRERLRTRRVGSAQLFSDVMGKREEDYGRFGYVPKCEVSDLFPGTFYLKEVDADGERSYAQVPYR